MTDIKSFLHHRSNVHKFEVTEGRLRAFCQSVGAEYRESAPPTFMTVFRDGEFELFDRMGIQLKTVLHADQEYRYENLILPGDQLEFQAVMTKAFEKKSSKGSVMRFLTFETEVKVRRTEGWVLAGVS